MTTEYTMVSFERRKKAVLRLQERLLGQGQSPAINRSHLQGVFHKILNPMGHADLLASALDGIPAVKG